MRKLRSCCPPRNRQTLPGDCMKVARVAIRNRKPDTNAEACCSISNKGTFEQLIYKCGDFGLPLNVPAQAAHQLPCFRLKSRWKMKTLFCFMNRQNITTGEGRMQLIVSALILWGSGLIVWCCLVAREAGGSIKPVNRRQNS